MTQMIWTILKMAWRVIWKSIRLIGLFIYNEPKMALVIVTIIGFTGLMATLGWFQFALYLFLFIVVVFLFSRIGYGL